MSKHIHIHVGGKTKDAIPSDLMGVQKLLNQAASDMNRYGASGRDEKAVRKVVRDIDSAQRSLQELMSAYK